MAEKIKFKDIPVNIKRSTRYPRDKYLFLFPESEVFVKFIGKGMMLYQNFPSEGKPFFSVEKVNNLPINNSSIRYVSFVIDKLDNDKIKLFICQWAVMGRVIGDICNTHNFPELTDEKIELYDVKARRYGNKIRVGGSYSVRVTESPPPTKRQKEIVENTLERYSLVDICVNNIDWDLNMEMVQPLNRYDILDL